MSFTTIFALLLPYGSGFVFASGPQLPQQPAPPQPQQPGNPQNPQQPLPQNPQNPQQNPQQNPPTQPGQPVPGQQYPAQQGQPQQGLPTDPISKAKQVLEQTSAAQLPVVKPITLDAIAPQKVEVNDPVVFTAVARDPSHNSTVQFDYQLLGAPYGATLDQNSGQFTWTPGLPGIYAFFIIVGDNSNPQRLASTPVTIVVMPPLPVFGGDFFVKPRSLINNRLLAMQAGYSPLGTNGPYPLSQQPNGGNPYYLQPNQANSFNQLSQITNMQQAAQAGLAPGQQGQQGQYQSYGNSGIPQPALPNYNGVPQPGQFNQYGPYGQTAPSPLNQFNNPLGGALGGPGFMQAPGGFLSPTQTGGFAPTYGAGSYGQSFASPGVGGGGLSQMLQGGGLSQLLQGANGSGISQLLQGAGGGSGLGQLLQGGSLGNGGFGTGGFGSGGFSSGLGGGGLGQLLQGGGLSQLLQGGGGQVQQLLQQYGVNPGAITGSGGGGIQQLLNGGQYSSIFGGGAPVMPMQNPTLPYQMGNGIQSPLLNPQAGDNSAEADALRYFVGPFDMLGLNVYVPAPDRYQLGPGDLLTARYWTRVLPATVVDLKVDGRGELAVPSDGKKISVRGLTLARAQELLKKVMARDLKDVDLTLTLKTLRTMSITVLGDAYCPGNYQVPAVATLFNALYMFGGPSDTGSYRSIELRRSDGSVKTFDLYKFLIKGDKSQDEGLQPGDTIYVPPARSHVEVRGEVMRPASYEATTSDRLKDLIAYAGGAKATGIAQRVSLTTVKPGANRQLKDVDLNASGPSDNPPLFDGDIAEVFSVRDEIVNRVDLDGAVDQPGQYGYVDGLTVADLVTKAKGLLKDAYLNQAEIYRENNDKKSTTVIRFPLDKAIARDPSANLALAPKDRVLIHSLSDLDYNFDRSVLIQGAVQKPGTYTRADNMTVRDVLLLAGGLTPDAFAGQVFLQHMNKDGTDGPLVTVDLNRLIAGDATQNAPLQDKDVLTVQTVQQHSYIPDQTVSILGAVQAPGSYPHGQNMRLSDLFSLAGGTLPDAGDQVEIAHARVPINTPPLRLSLKDILAGDPVSNMVLDNGDMVTIASRHDIQLHPMKVMILGEVKKPGPYLINGQTDRVSDLIARAGGFTPDAFPTGSEFFREPTMLTSDNQTRVQPRILEALSEVVSDEYRREAARADIEKFRIITGSSNGSNFSIPIPGLGTASTGGASGSLSSVPQSLINDTVVTQARILTVDDLTPGGNVNVDIAKALAHRKGHDDVVLKDGDIIEIPVKPTSVSVIGAVVVPAAVLFEPGRNLNYYVTRAGGYSVDADKGDVLILRYGGLVIKATNHTEVKVGDIIWVPSRVMSANLESQKDIIDTVTKEITTGVLLFAVLKAFGI